MLVTLTNCTWLNQATGSAEDDANLSSPLPCH